MTIKDLYAAHRPALSPPGEAGSTPRGDGSGRDLRVSYELYPPRNARPTSQAWAGIDRLLDSRPDYVSVTFGTSGTTPDASQSVLWHALKRSGRPVLAHLTCVGKTRAKLVGIVQDMMDLGVRDFLALRGDEAPEDEPREAESGEFDRAFQLVQLIREVSADYLGDEHAVSMPEKIMTLANIADPAERILESLGATLDFVNDLIEANAPGIHFYTFNRPRPVLDLVEHLHSRGFAHVDQEDSHDLLGLMNAAMHRISP